METDPKKIDFGKIDPYQKSEGGNMKEGLRASRGDYDKNKNAESVNKNKTISAPPIPASPSKKISQVAKPILSSPTELLSEACQLYRSKIKTFLGITVIPILLMFLAGVIIGIGFWGLGMMNGLSPESFFDNPIGISIFLVLGFLFFIPLIIIQIWSQAALIYAIKEKGEIGIKEAYQKSKNKIGQFFWVSLLAGFITMGGFMFFAIPGFIFGIWFSFAAYIVITEDLRGMNAILKSREYVRNYWWPVFWRFLFINLIMIGVMIIAALASMLIPLLADIVSIILTPLIMIYSFLIYDNLRKIKGDFEFRPSSGLKKKFIAIGILGFIIIPLLFSSIVLVSLNSAKDKAMDAKRRSEITQIKNDLMLYHDEKGKYPKSLSELDLEYMDPKTKEPYEYRQLDNGKDYEICVLFKENDRQCFSSKDDVYGISDKYRYDYNGIDDAEKEIPDDSITRRDALRVSDLKLISLMLKKCETEEGRYPLSQTTMKLNEDNYVVSKIKTVNTNIELPFDPKDPEYYYGYKSSDGKSFELTTRLENINDSRCNAEIKENNGICIYELRN